MSGTENPGIMTGYTSAAGGSRPGSAPINGGGAALRTAVGGAIMATGATNSFMDIACGNGTLRITRLQLPGSRAQSVNDLINGGKELLMPGQELR